MGIYVPRNTDARLMCVCNRKFVYLLADGADECYRNECLRSVWLSDMFYLLFI